MKASLLEVVAFVVADDLHGELAFSAHVIEACLLFEPVLVAAGFPAGDLSRVKVGQGSAEFLKDFGVGNAVANHGVDLGAEFEGEPGDVAGATPGATKRFRLRWRAGWGAGFGSWFHK